ncbi:esterase/lipase family protein [Alteriqipengyuania lutimaris]|uniref:Alpha/beta fold hydrolase n=1 Tax=Alteriqipengyuania lutimaris TaxID=1538146 RepID=A0A395LNB4_9SPHN|nr:alpha/beta fold hydrolase [Alteriqipengyuania lutimaris]RDS78556.1 alpha/beta fold hydrolase [Alteriqipengyuania lutimaris]
MPGFTALADSEWARRLELAREPDPDGARSPRLWYLIRELGYLLEPLRRLYRSLFKPFRLAQAARPRMVMILPGFGTNPIKMRYFARRLEDAGHTVKRWGCGYNWGFSDELFGQLEERLLDLHSRAGEPVVLVGWSLGGLYARELAKRQPDAVAKVISMGSPFSGSPRANNVWRIYQMVAGHRIADVKLAGQLSSKPPVETVALWSPRDGAIDPRSAAGYPGERDRAVALRCSHMGFSYAPEAIRAVAREIDRAATV